MLVLRPLEGFSQPDYGVIFKREDGSEEEVGRIYYSVSVSSDPELRWWWGLYGDYRHNRPLPHAGLAADLDEAKADFRRCWESSAPRPLETT